MLETMTRQKEKVVVTSDRVKLSTPAYSLERKGDSEEQRYIVILNNDDLKR